MGNQRTEHGEDRRAQLLEVAAALFVERGYRATRIADIASGAGVAKGLLYWYFPSKEALLHELAADVQRQLRELQRASLRGVSDPLERIYVATLATTRYVAEHVQVYGAIQSADGRTADSPFGRLLANHATDSRARISEGQRAGAIRRDDRPEALAFGLSALVNEFVHFHAMGLVDGTVDDLARVVARQAVRLVAADSDRAAAVLRRHRSLAARAEAARHAVAVSP